MSHEPENKSKWVLAERDSIAKCRNVNILDISSSRRNQFEYEQKNKSNFVTISNGVLCYFVHGLEIKLGRLYRMCIDSIA